MWKYWCPAAGERAPLRPQVGQGREGHQWFWASFSCPSPFSCPSALPFLSSGNLEVLIPREISPGTSCSLLASRGRKNSLNFELTSNLYANVARKACVSLHFPIAPFLKIPTTMCFRLGAGERTESLTNLVEFLGLEAVVKKRGCFLSCSVGGTLGGRWSPGLERHLRGADLAEARARWCCAVRSRHKSCKCGGQSSEAKHRAGLLENQERCLGGGCSPGKRVPGRP